MLRRVQFSCIIRDDNGVPLAHVVREETALVLELAGIDCPDGGTATGGAIVRDLDPDIVGLLDGGTMVLVDGCPRHEGTTIRELVRRKAGGFMLRTLGRPRHPLPDPVLTARLLGLPPSPQAADLPPTAPPSPRRRVGRPAGPRRALLGSQEKSWPLVPRSTARSSSAGPASLLGSPDPLVPRTPPAPQQSR